MIAAIAPVLIALASFILRLSNLGSIHSTPDPRLCIASADDLLCWRECPS